MNIGVQRSGFRVQRLGIQRFSRGGPPYENSPTPAAAPEAALSRIPGLNGEETLSYQLFVTMSFELSALSLFYCGLRGRGMGHSAKKRKSGTPLKERFA
jgi:hypothetical protein